MSSHARKRSRIKNMKKATAANPNFLKSDQQSSSEETRAKKGKAVFIKQEDLNQLICHVRKELEKAMENLNESTAEERDSLECKLDLAEAKLDEEKDKLKGMRAKYVAAVKREKRVRNKVSTTKPAETQYKFYKPYFKCTSGEKEIRKKECIGMINEMVGMDESHEEFSKSRMSLLMDVLDELGIKTKLTIEQDLQLSILFSLPDHSREALKKYLRDHLSFDVFASNAAVRLSRKAICDTKDWRYDEFPDKSGASDGKKGKQDAYSYYDANIKSSLCTTIQALISSSKLNLGHPYNNVVCLVVQLDKGGSLTKLGFSISNVSIKVGSPSNFTLFGLTSLGEEYSNMQLAFGQVFQQIHQLNGTTLRAKINGVDVDVKIRFKLGGDWKSISMMMGHGGAASKHHCPICIGTKTVVSKWDTKKKDIIRTGYVIGEHNISRPQLIPSITATDITIPVNHVMTGMTKKAMALLMKILGGEATEWNDEKADRLQELTSSIAITIGGLETIRELKQKIIEIHAATGKLKNKRQGSVEHCNDMCLFNLISNDDLKWDMVPCSECGKSNHEVCGRVWNGEMLTANNIKTFRCVQCRGETIASLMTLDKEYIEELEVAETEIMGNMETYECERNELIRDEGRTNESLVAALDALKIKCGVYNRYYYADLVGADARRLTRHENAVKLWELVENEEIRSNGVKLFDAIHDIFKILTTGYHSPAEISEFDRLIESIQVIWSQLNPSETVPLKLHSLMHISESMKREGHGGREIELIEHCHHCLNVLIPRYITITPLNRRLAIVVNRFNSKRYLLN